jgi:hypothetical protein
VAHPTTEGRVIARSSDDKYELLAIEIVLPIDGAFNYGVSSGSVVSIGEGTAGPYAFASRPDEVSTVERRGVTATTIWVRRPKDQTGKAVEGIVFTPSIQNEPGHRIPFHAPGASLPGDPKLLPRWAAALAAHLRELGSGPWHRFAAQRVEQAFAQKKALAAAQRPTRAGRDDLLSLMDTTTGMLSIQESLQQDRPLLLRAAREKQTVPISKLPGVKAAAHPWDRLLQSLAAPGPAEPMAAAVPAEFWYFRFADLGALFRLADQLDAWGTPAADALDRQLEERDLSARYETELGLARTELARTFGKEVIDEVAITGSDPYLREGSDLTVIFRVKRRPVLESVLASTLAAHSKVHGGTTSSKVSHEGVDIHIARSADGRLRQHRASVDDFEIVSNSLGAARRVIEAMKGKRARLSEEKDFRYMLARDSRVRGDALGFMGDRFVAEVVGPRQKILEARRQIAAAELMTPGFAALLHGFIHGRSPSSVDELVASRLLGKDELRHAGGAAIAFRPGEAAQSPWGSPLALTPLIDLPAVEMVTESEQAAYARFAQTYETYWSRYIDPVLLSLSWSEKGTTLEGDLRVLPLIEGTDYREIMEFAGTSRVKAPPLAAGMRAVVGIGLSAELRNELSRMSRSFSRHHDLKLDFLGDWAMVGVADRAPIATAIHALESHLPELPNSEERREEDEIATLARVPAYAAIGIRSMAGAALLLAALRQTAEDALPGMVSWGEAGKEREIPIVRIGVADPRGPRGRRSSRTPSEGVSIFYALTESALLVSLDERVLRGLIDDLVDGRLPGPAAAPRSDGSQLVFDLAGAKNGALVTVLGWLLSSEVVAASESSRAHAQALLLGAPERANDPAALRALSLAYFGSAPVPPYGGHYTIEQAGVRDPARGTTSSPRWPSLPVEGSPVDKLLTAVGRFRSEIAFDREGPKGAGGMQSLHVRVALGLRGP